MTKLRDVEFPALNMALKRQDSETTNFMICLVTTRDKASIMLLRDTVSHQLYVFSGAREQFSLSNHYRSIVIRWLPAVYDWVKLTGHCDFSIYEP